MDIEQIRTYCLSKDEVEEAMPFGPDVVVFKTNSKIFLLLPLDTAQTQFNVKCNPEKAEELRETYACVIPGYHMNKKHWNTIIVDGTVATRVLQSWIDDSYNLVSRKKK